MKNQPPKSYSPPTIGKQAESSPAKSASSRTCTILADPEFGSPSTSSPDSHDTSAPERPLQPSMPESRSGFGNKESVEEPAKAPVVAISKHVAKRFIDILLRMPSCLD